MAFARPAEHWPAENLRTSTTVPLLARQSQPPFWGPRGQHSLELSVPGREPAAFTRPAERQPPTSAAVPFFGAPVMAAILGTARSAFLCLCEICCLSPEKAGSHRSGQDASQLAGFQGFRARSGTQGPAGSGSSPRGPVQQPPFWDSRE